MTDFTALKTAIQNAIKQNGNEEITGDILQDVLLAIVTTLGDGSINDLITALGSEVTTRGNADTTLQQNINAEAQARQQAVSAEAQARQQADTTLGGRIDGVIESINAINAAIENGYVYAGIATPSSTPTTGKVFYLALTAGTYTNFGSTVVTQGINILKYNGSAWSLDAFVAIDDAPTPSSNNLVKSGGVFDKVMNDGSAFDISAHFGSGGKLATYADLSAALTALNTLSAAYKKGGMSIKFVQSSDNKYVQYFLTKNVWSTLITDWNKINVTDELDKIYRDLNSAVTLTPDSIPIPFSASNPFGDIYSPLLKKGNTIKILVTSCVSDGVAQTSIDCFGAPPQWVRLGDIIIGTEKVITLTQDFDSIRCGSGEVYDSFVGTYKIISNVANELSKLVPDVQQLKENVDKINSDIKQETYDFSFTNTSETDLYSPYIKAGNTIEILINQAIINGGTPSTIIVHGQRPNTNWVIIGRAIVGSKLKIELNEDFNFIRLGSGETYEVLNGSYTFNISGSLVSRVLNLEDEAEEYGTQLDDLSQKVIPISDSFRFENTEASDIYSPYLRTGNIFSILVDEAIDSGSQTYNQALFGRPINDIGWVRLGSVVVGSEKTITLEQDFLYIRIGEGQTHDLVRGSYNIFTKECVDISRKIEKIVDQGDYRSNTQYRVLVLGDSFSQGGGNWTQPMVELLGTNSSIISLGVSSATVHVRYNDTVNYPFTDRPVSSDNSGNHNAMYSQVLKLKRLMAGTDLDEGETAIYQTQAEYPNVIIIEGGMNDWYDTDEIVELYTSYLNKFVTNVYTKQNTSVPEAELGSTIIKTPLEETNKRSFLVSYRMMIEELHDIFPNAQIFITTVCPTAWAPTGQARDMAADKHKIASQQRYCADLLGVSVIDWYRDGQISYLWNNVQGSGTQEDPYIWGQNLLPYPDNGDLLHPNERGGKKYGRLAACVIKNNFLKIE